MIDLERRLARLEQCFAEPCPQCFDEGGILPIEIVEVDAGDDCDQDAPGCTSCPVCGLLPPPGQIRRIVIVRPPLGPAEVEPDA